MPGMAPKNDSVSAEKGYWSTHTFVVSSCGLKLYHERKWKNHMQQCDHMYFQFMAAYTVSVSLQFLNKTSLLKTIQP